MSPAVAIRATWAMVWVVTPRRAASSRRGRITSSGPAGGLEVRILATDLSVAIWRCSSRAASSRFSPVSLTSNDWVEPEPKLEPA